MFIVYVLRDTNGKVYKGVTNNLIRRLREHRSGETLSTRRMQGIDVVYTEEYPDFQTARSREVYFKTAAGRRFLKKHLE